MQNNINVDLKKLTEIFENRENIIIYGAGILGQGLYLLLDKMGYGDHVQGFAVSPHSDHLNSYMDKEIRCIDQYDLSNTCVVIAVKEKFLDGIMENLNYFRSAGMEVWYVGISTLKEMFASAEKVVDKFFLDKLSETDVTDEEFVTFCIRQIRRTQLDFEINIVDHCNLNCQCCNHFSPIANEKYLDVNEFEKDMCRIQELTKGDVGRIWLLGGEPLLHPSLIQIMFITRKYFPQTHITINTNGVLLLKQGDEFWKALRDTGIELTITKYPINVNYDLINLKLDTEQIKYAYSLASQVLKTTYHLPLDLDGKQDIVESYIRCWHANYCITLRDGRLFTCPIAANAHHFNSYFEKDLDVGDRNSISIYEAENIGDIIDFFKKPIPFCCYCNIKGYTFDLPWGISKRDISEWT